VDGDAGHIKVQGDSPRLTPGTTLLADRCISSTATPPAAARGSTSAVGTVVRLTVAGSSNTSWGNGVCQFSGNQQNKATMTNLHS
jgi:hypothetical protein